MPTTRASFAASHRRRQTLLQLIDFAEAASGCPLSSHELQDLRAAAPLLWSPVEVNPGSPPINTNEVDGGGGAGKFVGQSRRQGTTEEGRAGQGSRGHRKGNTTRAAIGPGPSKKNQTTLKHAHAKLQKLKAHDITGEAAAQKEKQVPTVNSRRGWVERSKQRLLRVELLSIQEPLSEATELLCHLSSASLADDLQRFNALLQSQGCAFGPEATLPLPDISSDSPSFNLGLQVRQTLEGIAVTDASSKLLFFSKCLLQLRLASIVTRIKQTHGFHTRELCEKYWATALGPADAMEVERVIKRVNEAVDRGTKWARLAQGGSLHLLLIIASL
ncbi:hypothetical protein CALVIDRAFT_431043 [Calocera viscosa TUFC12733]|uniref:Uncharacterized protein n=1 Tax=Calocera viscosa (strain TUFC12733) TaxID=1330018 RepID=A0A167FZ90_CALVF|nr:hypothetical protein CALVIDRAFT_431043 [Calocera viscosa TUFC12733]